MIFAYVKFVPAIWFFFPKTRDVFTGRVERFGLVQASYLELFPEMFVAGFLARGVSQAAIFSPNGVRDLGAHVLRRPVVLHIPRTCMDVSGTSFLLLRRRRIHKLGRGPFVWEPFPFQLAPGLGPIYPSGSILKIQSFPKNVRP